MSPPVLFLPSKKTYKAKKKKSILSLKSVLKHSTVAKPTKNIGRESPEGESLDKIPSRKEMIYHLYF